MPKNFFNNCSVTPTVVNVGDSLEITVSLTVGEDFSAKNSRIIFDLPAYLGFDRPTKIDQESGGYCEIFCDNPEIKYECRTWDMEINDFPTMGKSSFKGMAQRLLVLDFLDGTACAGDTIVLKWGWIRNGFGIGCKVTTLALNPEFELVINVRYFKDGSQGLPDYGRSYLGFTRPTPDVDIPLAIKANPLKAESLRLVRSLKEDALLIYDRFFNICWNQKIEEVATVNNQMTQNELGVWVCKPQDTAVISSNLPLKVTPIMENVWNNLNIYWGDLHTHSAFSIDCIEREKQQMGPNEQYKFARDTARLDFLAITDHHQPWDVERRKLGEKSWNTIIEAGETFTEAGRFLAFGGFEFRCPRGDTAVIFEDKLPSYELINQSSIKRIDNLWESLRDKSKFITIPHYHNAGHDELKDSWIAPTDMKLEPMQEVYSCHGAYDVELSNERTPPMIKRRIPTRNGKWMLDQGIKYGTCCNSDGHKGNPGSNGLTAVYAPELTKEAIFNAIRNRQVYGTTNARIRLLFLADEQLMGSVLSCKPTSLLQIKVAGEMPIKSVEFIKNGELFKRERPMSLEYSTSLKIEAQEQAYWYVRIVQVDNHIAWSSPIWFE